MENPINLETVAKVAKKVEDRAEKVGNERTDVVSKMARGILDLEVWVARKIREKQSIESLPELLKISPEKQRAFYSSLKVMEDDIVAELRRQHSGFVAPEMVPKPNLCGFTATAITEAFRRRGGNARVVYGHHRNNGSIIYHYWTEVVDDSDGRKYVVDATYGQFDPSHQEDVIVYPIADLPQYGLKEYKEGEGSVLKLDEGTIAVLRENNGMLPIRQDLQGKRAEAYENLVRSLG